MKNLIAVLLVLIGATPQARAEDSGNSMIEGCKGALTASTTLQAAYCLGSLTMLGMISPFIDKEFAFCPPAKATGLQIVRIVVKYMDDHPAELDRPFSFIALHSLQEAWPCKK